MVGQQAQLKPASGKYLRYPSTLISYKGMSFLIIDAPVDTSLPQYISELRKYNAKHLVRACEATYHSSPLVEAGIEIHELPFADGEPPPKKVIDEWLALVDAVFDVGRAKKARDKDTKSKDDLSAMVPPDGGHSKETDPPIPEASIAAHCQAGLGRAPALVAIALMERGGLDPLDAIMYIRERRKGAFNAKQMAYLEAYNAHRKKTAKCCLLQ
uniref:Tyrosine specific protein phosphatases domain-containing protein n=1 Tax=Eutreptiella gymnastica TaxID=73025 RepID=A0A7S4GIA0_9EUGL|mmetsp:Transcript_30111/g.48366  ORF Transcript_30111/g.48366 Transcript_30111/m.48366 type:complete len:213 (+) Transcript_30111:92-730(+)